MDAPHKTIYEPVRIGHSSDRVSNVKLIIIVAKLSKCQHIELGTHFF